MSGRAGIEITPDVVRVVRVAPYTGRVLQAVEISWDPQQPGAAIATLRANVRRPGSISIAIGLGFLQVMRVDLPPVAPSERARIIELEPDRYFAAVGRGRLVATTAPDAPIAFGASDSMIAAVIALFEAFAPVDWVEPAPIAVARALGHRDGAWRLEAGAGETGVLHIDRGRIVSIRRTTDAAAGSSASAVPSNGTTPASFAAALGAATWRPQHARGVPALAPSEWRRRLALRQRAATTLGAMTLAAAVLFAVWSADRWRERALAALHNEVARLETQVAPADTALRMLRSRELEAQTIRDITASRADPLLALAAISAALPREAVVLSARVNRNDWQIDGTTNDASTLVPLLDRHEQFDSVRFLSASSRYRDANRSYETFSIAFRYRSRP